MLELGKNEKRTSGWDKKPPGCCLDSLSLPWTLICTGTTARPTTLFPLSALITPPRPIIKTPIVTPKVMFTTQRRRTTGHSFIHREYSFLRPSLRVAGCPIRRGFWVHHVNTSFVTLPGERRCSRAAPLSSCSILRESNNSVGASGE